MQKENSRSISIEMLLKNYKDQEWIVRFLLEQYYSSDSDLFI